MHTCLVLVLFIYFDISLEDVIDVDHMLGPLVIIELCFVFCSYKSNLYFMLSFFLNCYNYKSFKIK